VLKVGAGFELGWRVHWWQQCCREPLGSPRALRSRDSLSSERAKPSRDHERRFASFERRSSTQSLRSIVCGASFVVLPGALGPFQSHPAIFSNDRETPADHVGARCALVSRAKRGDPRRSLLRRMLRAASPASSQSRDTVRGPSSATRERQRLSEQRRRLGRNEAGGGERNLRFRDLRKISDLPVHRKGPGGRLSPGEVRTAADQREARSAASPGSHASEASVTSSELAPTVFRALGGFRASLSRGSTGLQRLHQLIKFLPSNPVPNA